MARTFEFVLHFVECVTVTVSPNQIIIIIIITIFVAFVISVASVYQDGLKKPEFYKTKILKCSLFKTIPNF